MATKNQKNSAFMKPVKLSNALEEVIGSGPMPRTEVTKRVWDYIKKHNLQDPKNKRNINPDPKLSKVFGSSKSINMFDMTRALSKHLST